MARGFRIAGIAAVMVMVGLALGIAGSSAGESNDDHAESPGQAAVELQCPTGDKQIIGEAIYPADAPTTGVAPREALRDFLRTHFRELLKLKFITVASPAARIQLAARLDGHPVASVLLTRTDDGGVRPEGATACESLLRGR
jgi:hypothetical protein